MKHKNAALPKSEAKKIRMTPIRNQVLQILKDSHIPLSHSDIEGHFNQDTGIDRVTLYRTLDWLANNHLAYKSTDQRGVFCYIATQVSESHNEHLHFHCIQCGSIYCLDAAIPPNPQLPAGFSFQSMVIDLRGQCSKCSQTS